MNTLDGSELTGVATELREVRSSVDGLRGDFSPILKDWSRLQAQVTSLVEQEKVLRGRVHEHASFLTTHQLQIEILIEDSKAQETRLRSVEDRFNKIVNRGVGIVIAAQFLLAFKGELAKMVIAVFGGN